MKKLSDFNLELFHKYKASWENSKKKKKMERNVTNERLEETSTANKVKNQPHVTTTISTNGRGVLKKDKMQQQSLAGRSTIQVGSSTQAHQKKKCLANRSVVQTSTSTQVMYQHELCKKNKIAPKIPATTIDDYIRRNKQQFEVDELEDEGTEGSDSENDYVEKTIDNPMDVDGLEDEETESDYQQEIEEDLNYENDNVEQTNDNLMNGETSKRKRGRTLCLKIHARKLNERQEITLNEKGEPIGPNQKVVSEFSNFLGTLARSADVCPLGYTNWKEVPNKDKNIWHFVNQKYIVPENEKKAVFAIINDAWRRYKWFIKKEHFSKYNNMAERMKNKPENIPEIHFKKLLKYWRLEQVQERCRQNGESIAQQKWRHRAGPISFAVIRERLRASKEGKESPTQAEVFIETRKSKRGEKLDQDTDAAISKLQELIANSGQPSTEVFQCVFGKEKPGRVRCYGRTTTASLLKRNKEIKELEKKHADEVKRLTDKVEEMKTKHEEMEAKHEEMELKFQLLISTMLNQNNSRLDMETLATLFTFEHAPNNHKESDENMNREDVEEDEELDD